MKRDLPSFVAQLFLANDMTYRIDGDVFIGQENFDDDIATMSRFIRKKR